MKRREFLRSLGGAAALALVPAAALTPPSNAVPSALAHFDPELGFVPLGVPFSDEEWARVERTLDSGIRKGLITGWRSERQQTVLTEIHWAVPGGLMHSVYA